MNFSAIMQLKNEWDGFKLRHPKQADLDMFQKMKEIVS